MHTDRIEREPRRPSVAETVMLRTKQDMILRATDSVRAEKWSLKATGQKIGYSSSHARGILLLHLGCCAAVGGRTQMKRLSFGVVSLVVACSSAQPVPTGRDSGLGGGSQTSGANNAVTGGAGASTDATANAPVGVITNALHRCGGSDLDETTQAVGVSDAAPRPYCDAEVISWSCNPDNPGLKLRVTRQLYHCCPSLSADLTPEGEAYRLTLTDQRAGHGCDCGCVFDVDIHAGGIPCTDTTLIFGTQSFPLPLSRAQGVVVVSDEPSSGCSFARHEVSATTDADTFLPGETVPAYLRNDTNDTVYLPGCADYTVERFDGTTWLGSNLDAVECDTEGAARPVQEGTIYDIAHPGGAGLVYPPHTDLGGPTPPVGMWRICFDVNYGCLPDRPISQAECTRHQKVCTASFTVGEG